MTPSHVAIEAVVFDLDGVLVDSESVWDEARRAVVDRYGGHWREPATKAMMGMSSPEWSRYLHDKLGVSLAPQEINDEVVSIVLERYRHDLPLLPGAVRTVRRLAARWPLGLASSANRPVIDTVLETAGLADSFSATVSGEEVARGKPAPDVYLAAVSQARGRGGASCRCRGLDQRPARGSRGGNGGDRSTEPRLPARAGCARVRGARDRLARRAHAEGDRGRRSLALAGYELAVIGCLSGSPR